MKYKVVRGFNVVAPPSWRGKGQVVEFPHGKELRFEEGDTFTKLPEVEDLEYLLQKGTVVPVEEEASLFRGGSLEEGDE